MPHAHRCYYYFEIEGFEVEVYEQQQKEGTTTMSIVKAIRNRREATRNRRELQRAFGNAATPGLRDELIFVAQRDLAQRSR